MSDSVFKEAQSFHEHQLGYRVPAKQSFFIPFLLPGLNESLGKANQRYGKSNAYAISKARLEAQIHAVIKCRCLHAMEAVMIEWVWREPNMRRDPDNIISAKKYILDALVAEGILPGDGWEYIKGFTEEWVVDRENPGVSVRLKPSYADGFE